MKEQNEENEDAAEAEEDEDDNDIEKVENIADNDKIVFIWNVGWRYNMFSNEKKLYSRPTNVK